MWGSTKSRGYGVAHQRLRRRFALQVAAGGVSCARCGLLIEPGEPWDLGHDDDDRRFYSGPEHRRCNRSAPGLRRELLAQELADRWSREEDAWWQSVADEAARKRVPRIY
jgi:hypothetical protein